MKNTETQNGITLIALIITIVVLLILAVVAIGAAQESDIVGYAQNASAKYKEGEELEIWTLGKYENIIKDALNATSGEITGIYGPIKNKDGQDVWYFFNQNQKLLAIIANNVGEALIFGIEYKTYSTDEYINNNSNSREEIENLEKEYGTIKGIMQLSENGEMKDRRSNFRK